MAKGRTARLVRVHGKVQGVYFRGWTQAQARHLGLRGWVRNERDGSVTAMIAGPRADVENMIAMLWQGPPAAAVRIVSTEPAEPVPWPERFEIVD